MSDKLLEKLRLKLAREEFSQKPIPDELMEKLLDAANHAPSGFNMQPWHFLLLKDPNLKNFVFM
jgi:5,6-dimethylbenzimidazole synthase